VYAITVVYSPAPRQTREWQFDIAAGSSAKQAVLQSGILQEFPELKLDGLKLGIWGKRCAIQQALKDQDRIEIYRQLRVDPKVARRERFTSQGAKRAGLFATKRAGAKAGYGG
jgi:putative ubiquitin-RnfH superfamily antitoxin RatB of RatAB toxin-antitoxin module